MVQELISLQMEIGMKDNGRISIIFYLNIYILKYNLIFYVYFNKNAIFFKKLLLLLNNIIS